MTDEKLVLSPTGDINSLIEGPGAKMVAVGDGRIPSLGKSIGVPAQGVPQAPVAPVESMAATGMPTVPVTPASTDVPVGVVNAVNNFLNEPSQNPAPAFSPTGYNVPNMPTVEAAGVAPEPDPVAQNTFEENMPKLTDPMAADLTQGPAGDVSSQFVGDQSGLSPEPALEYQPEPVNKSFVPEYHPEPVVPEEPWKTEAVAPVEDAQEPAFQPEPMATATTPVEKPSVPNQFDNKDEYIKAVFENLRRAQEDEAIYTMMLEEALKDKDQDMRRAA